MAAGSVQHGVTLVFAAPMAFAGELTMLGENQETRDPVEKTSHQTVDGQAWTRKALINYGTVDFEMLFDPELGVPDLKALAGLATITYVKTVTPGAPATRAGTAQFTSVTYPSVEQNATEVAKVSGTFIWDNDGTAPLFTEETSV